MRPPQFSVFVFILLAAEIVSPFAYAQQSPAPAGSSRSIPIASSFPASPSQDAQGASPFTGLQVATQSGGAGGSGATPPTPPGSSTTPASQSASPSASTTPPPSGASTSPSPSIPTLPSAAPMQVGACVISELTPQQSLNFLNAVSGFTGKEITDRSDASLRKNATTSPTQIVNVYNFPIGESTSFMKLGQLAQITGRSAKDLADELGVDDDKDADGKVTTPAAEKEVTVAQASALAQKDPKLSGLLGQIRAAAQTKKNAATGPGFEELKVTLPNSKEVQLSEMFKLQKIRETPGQRNACLVDNADIRGKLTYNALLDRDLLIGADRRNSTLEDSQHLGTDSIQGGLNSFDGNIVIPREYERAVDMMKGWMSWDIIISGALAIGSFFDKKIAEKEIANIKEERELGKDAVGPLQFLAQGKGIDLTPTGSSFGDLRKRMVAKYGIAKPASLAEADIKSVIGPVNEYVKDTIDNGGYRVIEKKLGLAEDAFKGKSVGDVQKAVLEHITAEKDMEKQFSYLWGLTFSADEAKRLVASKPHIAEALAELGTSPTAGGGGGPNYVKVMQKIKDADIPNVDAKFGVTAGATLDEAFIKANPTKVEKALNDYAAEIDSRASKMSEFGTSGSEQIFHNYVSEQEGLKLAYRKKSNEDLVTAERAFTFSNKRFWTNVVMGMVWLGPGRLGLELAGVITFASNGKPANERGDFLRIYANSKPAEAFRKGTDLILLGSFTEVLSNFIPLTVPNKVYSSGDAILTQVSGDDPAAVNSRTSISNRDGEWNLATQWSGSSIATAFEDVRDGKSVTSMAVQSNYLTMGGVLQRRKEAQTYYQTILYIAPLLGWRLLGDKSAEIRGIATILQLEALQIYIDKIVDPNAFSDSEACSNAQLDDYVRGYKFAVAATTAEQVIYFSPFSAEFAPIFQAFSLSKLGKKVPPILSKANTQYTRIASVVDPLELWKQTAQSRVFNYALNCKDPSYKILSYQRIPEKSSKSSVLQSIQKKISDPFVPQIVKQLNAGSLFAGIGQQVTTKNLKEILNVKVLLQNQNGLLRPSELYYLHLDPDGADMQWWGVFENQCFRQCQVQADGTFICADNTGVYREKDGKREYLADSDHALLSQLIPGLGQVVPNKIISTPLSCGPHPVFTASGDGKFKIIPGGCAATECAIKALSIVSGQNVGNDLDKVLGPTQAIHTTQGTAVIADGGMRFFRTSGVKVSERNTVLGYIPTIGAKETVSAEAQKANASGFYQQQQSLAGKEYRFSALEILGDGTVRAAGSDKPEEQFGELLTIQSQNAVMHFDRATRRLVIGLQLFADPVAAHDITGITTSAAAVTGGKGDLLALERQLADLNSKLASGQQLNAAQLELLRKSIEKNSAPAQAGLTQAERDLLKQALADKNSGKPLSDAEKAILDKSQQQQPFPGVVLVTLPTAEKIDKAASDAGVGDSVKTATNKMRDSLPISTEDKNAVNAALDKAVQQDKIPPADAAQLKAQVQQAVPPSERGREITQALSSGGQLTPEQKLLAQQAVASEKASVGQQAASATGAQLPAIQLGGVTSKVGAEQSAIDLNRALGKLDGLTQFDSENRRVAIVDDGKGGAVVKVTDKTGTTPPQELKVTGAPTRDSSGAVSIPTEKGPVNVAVTVNPSTGQPVFNLNGPGGISAPPTPLIFAQGPNGYLWFDPKTGTWRTGNGMVVPDDPNFGKNGISFYGGQDGTTGLGDQNRFANPRQQQVGAYAGNNPLLSLPSVPDYGKEPLAAMAMLLALLLGVAFVRSREVSPKGI